eukprot:TRINITY_DN8070_c0_g1_i1.p1 TRINITY_DN8070_c0_g1~~TRINITY_DN8070_c0_g1_i1.p1  ORF type:complete len:255 (+),score=58.29 TRINITY_DN8070_c0_g1_i1:749-1513(+)
MEVCARTCENNARCQGFVYNNNSRLCVQASLVGGTVPSSPSMTTGCRNCPGISGDLSVFVLVRGIYNRTALSVNIGGVHVPSNAKMVTQYNHGLLKPVDYYDLVKVNGNNGMILMTILSVLSGDANFMEGCFHFYTNGSDTFPGEIMATGTEDYYNSGYYFINAYPQHLPFTGLTFNVPFTTPVGPFDKGMMWSVYRLHVADSLAFEGFGQLQWRNGDIVIPGRGKWLVQGRNGTVVGPPTDSYVRNYAMAYVW